MVMFKLGFKNISAAAIKHSRLHRVDNSPKEAGVDTIPTTKPVKFYKVETVPRNIYARLQTLSLLSITPAVSPPPGIIQHERSIIIIILVSLYLYYFRTIIEIQISGLIMKVLKK